MQAAEMLIKHVGNQLYPFSLLQALDNRHIHEEAKKNTNLKVYQLLKEGFFAGINTVSSEVLLDIPLSFIAKQLSSSDPVVASVKKTVGTQFFGMHPLIIALVIPVIEEVLFRLILQNGIKISQEWINKNFEKSINEKPFLKWCLSPSCRVILTNFLFALSHLTNERVGFSKTQAVLQSLRIMAYPTNSLLYETHNSLFAPLGAHIGQNCYVVAMTLVRKMVRG